MNIIGKNKSREVCISVDWMAFDFFVDEPLSERDIIKMKALGSFIYLRTLKQPFFKVENDDFIIKGIEGNKNFRVSFCNLSIEIFNIEEMIMSLYKS